jgi:hypothetical protein
MERAYYSNLVANFCKQRPDEILGEITRNNVFNLEQKQRNTWLFEIEYLQGELKNFPNGYVAFEYTIPRIGDRIDCIFFYNGIVYLIEFKVGEKKYPQYAIDQVMDYALDLKYFHKESHERKIVPILLCTDAPNIENKVDMDEDGVYKPIRCNSISFRQILSYATKELFDSQLSFENWINSQYLPTPTIIEAAQALYRGHDVKDISRSDSDAYNLSLTTNAINRIIDQSKLRHEKAICFITGVPGAGKTLAGLNIANSRHNFDQDEHAVFLSGNGPLVFVLREALARDEYERSGHEVKKSQVKKKVISFIQNIHHFREDALDPKKTPIEKVAIFDEAQRAWTKEQTAKFMDKRGKHNWSMSEPEFLISIMNRHSDWSVIVCLVGGGQEINVGEAGLPEWFDALKNHFSKWKVYISDKMTDNEYTRGRSLNSMISGLDVTVVDKLHLAVSIRSFRSELVSSFVKELLDLNLVKAQQIYKELQTKYPILITRNLETAKKWIHSKARGTERYGIIASSGARRLRSFGIWVKSDIEPEEWFLNPKEDIRSSYFLEETATEFDIQGLEIDWSIVAWDADYRIENDKFCAYSFKGTRWNVLRSSDSQLYLKNAYRVLLTRARQGFIIFIPEGDNEDITRQRKFYDNTYEYLKKIGIIEI